MGKKKGKQTGNFACKSLRASYAKEIQNHVHLKGRKVDDADDDYYHRHSRRASTNEQIRRGGGGWRNTELPVSSASANTVASSSSFCSNTSIGIYSGQRRPFKLRSLNQLRNIIRERQFFDRHEYRRLRLQQQQYQHQSPHNNKNHQNKKRHYHAPGWIIDYPNFSSSENNLHVATNNNNGVLPSLEQLCMATLTEYLQEYLDYMGIEDLHYVFSTLPSKTLTYISTHFKGQWNNDLLYVVGKHDHVANLAIHCSRHGNNHDTKNSRSKEIITDEGILDLIDSYKTESSIQNEISVSEHLGERDDIPAEGPDNWEEWLDNDEENFGRIGQFGASRGHSSISSSTLILKLKRLELVNINHQNNISIQTLSLLLRKCKGITHLSLSRSMFIDREVEIDDEEHKHQQEKDILPIIATNLPLLQVLDLSFCPWVTDNQLIAFWKIYQRRRRRQQPRPRQNNNYEKKKLLKKEEKRQSLIKNIPIVSILGCINISNQVKQELRNKYPNCILLEKEQMEEDGDNVDSNMSNTNGSVWQEGEDDDYDSDYDELSSLISTASLSSSDDDENNNEEDGHDFVEREE